MKYNIDKHIGKIKVGVAMVITFGSLSVLGTAVNVFAKDTDYKLAHQELDVQLQGDLDAWINSTATRRFCMPKANLLQEEIEIRAKLGDDVSSLQARKQRVIEDCTETVKQVLFQ